MSRFADLRFGLLTFGLFILLIVSFMLPPISFVTIWFLPLPFFLHGARFGGRSLAFPVALSGLFILLLFPHILLFSLFAFGVATGAAMGLLYRRDRVAGTDVVLGGVVTAWISMIILVILAASFTHLFSELATNWDKQWHLMEQQMKSMGTGESLPDPADLRKVLPGMMLLLLIPFPIFTFLLGRRFLSRSGLPRKELLPFRSWRLPRSFVYFYFVTLIGILLQSSFDWGSFNLLFSNAVALLYVLFIFQGWSLIAYLLYARGKSGRWMIIVIAISLILTPATVLIHLLGILDSGTQLRHRIKEKR